MIAKFRIVFVISSGPGLGVVYSFDALFVGDLWSNDSAIGALQPFVSVSVDNSE